MFVKRSSTKNKDKEPKEGKEKKESKEKKKDKDKEKDKKSTPKKSGPPPDLPPPPIPQEKTQDPSLSADASDKDYEEEGIIFSNGKEVKGGTLEKLVEKLTSTTSSDQKFIQAFMLTFRSFTTPLELLSLLKRRYYSEPPAEASSDEIEQFNNGELKNIRLRVSVILRHWIQKCFFDFQDEQLLSEEVTKFLVNDLSVSMKSTAEQLQKLMEKQAQMNGEAERGRDIQFTSKAPQPYLPRKFDKITLFDVHSEEFARQLTLIEYGLYKNIKPWECINQAWMKPDKDSKAPNIIKMINRFNDVSRWVASEICKTVDLKDRINVMQKMIEIADFCKSLNNLNAMMEIISGLNSSSVFRLKITWTGLTKKHLALWEEMSNIAKNDQSYKNLRQYLHNLNPPCIPYLGMYLTDLTFIEEGNNNKLADGKINFFKRQKLSEVISEIQIYQNNPYCLEEVAFIQRFLINVECLPEEQCYRLSQKRERKGGIVIDANDADADDDEPFGEMQKVDGYNFDQPDCDLNIKYEKIEGAGPSATPVIKGATLLKLIERQTNHDTRDDPVNTHIILLTYKSFAQASELLDLLIIRYNMPQPRNPSRQQHEKFQVRAFSIRTKIFSFIKQWIVSYPSDFKDDPVLKQQLTAFLEKSRDDDALKELKLDKLVQIVIDTLESKMQEEQANEIAPLIGCLEHTEPSQPIGKLIEYDPETLAKQLCLFDHHLFRLIKPREVLCKNFDVPSDAPTMFRMKQNFELMSRWAGSQIVSQPDARSRSFVLCHLIKIAEYLLEFNSFNSYVAIVRAFSQLQSSLLSTLDWLPQNLKDKYADHSKLIKQPRNLQAREKAKPAEQPAVPYLDLYIRQLTNYDVISDETEGSLINFEKRRKIYEVWDYFQTLQRKPFRFDSEPEFQDYLLFVPLYSEETIKKMAKSIPTEAPPVERPTVDSLPPPTRFASQDPSVSGKSRTESVSVEQDYSTSYAVQNYEMELANIPLQADDPQTQHIKSLIAAVISEDKSLVSDLINSVKETITNDILGELKSFSETIRDEVVLLHNQFAVANADLFWETAEKTVKRKFPQSSTVEIWRKFDSEGFVYGWQEEVGLFIIDGNQLVSVTGCLGKSYIGAILRIAGLYVSDKDISDEDQQNLVVTIISPSFSQETFDLAQQQNIQVVQL